MKSIFTFTALFIFTISFSQLIIKVDNIDVSEKKELECFFYPNSINISYKGYDSLTFKKGQIEYFDFLTEEFTTTNIYSGNNISVNSTGKLSASPKSKSKPIRITFKQAFGFKKGRQRKLNLSTNELKINLTKCKINNESEFSRINHRSEIKLKLDDEVVKENSVEFNASNQIDFNLPKNTAIKSGESIIIGLANNSTRPIWSTEFKTVEELTSSLNNRIPSLRATTNYLITFDLYLIDDKGKEITKNETLFFKLKLNSKINQIPIDLFPDSVEQFNVLIEQNGQVINPANGIVTLDKKKFDLILDFNKPMAILVNGSFNEKTFLLASENKSLAELPGFENTGMAEGRLNPDEVILISDDSPSYWYYENEYKNRFNKTGAINGRYKCVRTIANFDEVDTHQNIEVSNIDTPLYLVFINFKSGETYYDRIELQREYLKINWR